MSQVIPEDEIIAFLHRAVQRGCTVSYAVQPKGTGPESITIIRQARVVLNNNDTYSTIVDRTMRSGAVESTYFACPADAHIYTAMQCELAGEVQDWLVRVEPEARRPTRSEEQRLQLLTEQRAASQIAQQERAAAAAEAERQRQILLDTAKRIRTEQQQAAAEAERQRQVLLAETRAAAQAASTERLQAAEALNAKLTAVQQQLSTVMSALQLHAPPPPAPAAASAPAQLHASGTDVGAALLALAEALKPRAREEPNPDSFSLAHIVTWPTLLESGWPVFELTLRAQLPTPNEAAREEVDLLLAWCKAYFTPSDGQFAWPLDPATMAFAENLLRRARIASAGVQKSAVLAAMVKQDFALDPLGQAIATASKKPAAKSGGKKVTCWYCGLQGHSAHTCNARIKAGAPVPTAPLRTQAKEPTNKAKRQGEAVAPQ
jgi:hypothetical protein